jgi:hypothetical protein
VFSGGKYKLKIDKTYTFSVWLKAEAGTVSGTLRISDRDFFTDTKAFTATTTPQRFTFTSAGPWNVAATVIGGGLVLTNVGDTVLCWGGQLEQGAFPTSYIPTTSAAVTRNGDVPTVASLGSWYSANEGTIFAEASVPAIPVNAYGPVVELSDGTSNEYPVDLALVGNIAAAPFVGRLTAADGGVVQADITTGTPLVANTVYRLAAALQGE